MTTEQILALFNSVESMRAAQKEFFRNKSGAALRDSKMWESRVDRLIESLKPAAAAMEVKTEQKSLF